MRRSFSVKHRLACLARLFSFRGKPEKACMLRANIRQNDTSLRSIMTHETGKMLAAADFYPILQEFYGRMAAKRNEKTVLKKA